MPNITTNHAIGYSNFGKSAMTTNENHKDIISEKVQGRYYTRSRFFKVSFVLPAYRRLLFPLLHAEKEIGDVCTQATFVQQKNTADLSRL